MRGWRVETLEGQKFGDLLIKNIYSGEGYRTIKYLCLCDCGKECIKSHTCFKFKKSLAFNKHCGCKRKDPNQVSVLQRAVFKNNKFQSFNRNYAWELEFQEWLELTQQDCFYCGGKPQNKASRPQYKEPFYYNGVDRVDNTKGYTPDNCVPCCKQCNGAKSDYTLEEFTTWVRNIYDRLDKNGI